MKNTTIDAGLVIALILGGSLILLGLVNIGVDGFVRHESRMCSFEIDGGGGISAGANLDFVGLVDFTNVLEEMDNVSVRVDGISIGIDDVEHYADFGVKVEVPCNELYKWGWILSKLED